MNTQQLSKSLEDAFHKEGHRIVFWYDPEQSFEEELSSIDLKDVTVLNVGGESTFGLKIKLELQDPIGKYLLYFPMAEPEPELDWLLDIKLYSRCFYADRFSIIFNELGLHQQSLREHLSKRDKFLASKARVNALQRFVQPDCDEVGLDMAMIASVVKAESGELIHILMALADHAVTDDLGLEENPVCLSELEKFGLVPALVGSLQLEIGYPASVEELSGEEPFKLGHFFVKLLTTGLCESIGDVPDWAADLAMSAANSRATSRALLSRWRDSSRYYPAFDGVSAWVAEAVRIKDKLQKFDMEQLRDVVTFEAVEQLTIVELATSIPNAPKAELDRFRSIIALRLDGYWASKHKDDDTRRRYRTVYTSLQAAIDLFDLRLQHNDGFHYESCESLYKAYEKELYRFDLSYRHYFKASRESKVEILKSLDAEVEACYSNWFIGNLSKNWGDRVEAEERLDNWRFSDVTNQQDFYQWRVKPLFSSAAKRRIVVIISDAFRYEAAKELQSRINDKRYSEATLTSMLGVVPSYTTLGMASLLPHQTLEYKEGIANDVFVDGQSSKSSEARNKILAAHGGMAVTAETVKGWSRDAGREALKDQRLVYIYHNVIDDRSDSGGPSESDAFLHVEHAIEELTELSRKVLMHFNTSTVLITADHGFLFQQSELADADRASLAEKPTNVLKSKKRYVIGHGLPNTTEAWKGSTRLTAGTTSETDFWIPRGANRFHFVGGARFVHGGVMPQEIVVPVLTVKQLRGGKAEKRTKRKVAVISSKSTLKMVNNIQTFDLMQTESVNDQVLPVTLSVAIYDGGNKVSSEEIVTFDCATDSSSERLKKVRLSLSGTGFDRQQDYFLVLKDKDLNTELERYKVTIDLAFTDDFF